MQRTIDVAQQERIGLTVTAPLLQLIHRVQQHRTLSAGAIAGVALLKNERSAKEAEIKQAIAVVDKVMMEHASVLHAADAWRNAKAHWESLRTGGLAQGIDANREAHTAFISELLSLVAHVGQSSLLVLDPDASSYYLMVAAIDKFPAAVEWGSRLAAHAAAAMAMKEMDEPRRARLIGEEAVFLAKVQEFELALHLAMAANPKVATSMSALPATMHDSTRALLTVIHDDVYNAKFSVPVAQYWGTVLAFRHDLDEGNAALLPLLDELFAARIERMQHQYFLSVLVAGPAFLLLLLYLSAGAYVAVMESIQGLRDGAYRVAKGDFSTPIALPNRDELRRVAVSFNDMSRQLEIRTAQEREHALALQTLNGQLEKLSTTDALTGIANRRSFDTTLVNEWSRAARLGQPLALALIDVDWFKKYNDTYGHQAGDACLVRVAQVLERCMGRTGDLVARYGGEEFALIALNCDGKHALGIAEKICSELEALALTHSASHTGVVTVSVGISSVVPKADETPYALVKAADQALYLAKEKGRNQVVVGP